MGRLIDADVLKTDLTRFYDNEVTAKQLIDEQPTIDAAPVVRCMDCKNWDNSTDGRYVGGWCFCEKLQFSTSPDWYCADGVRKQNGTPE